MERKPWISEFMGDTIIERYWSVAIFKVNDSSNSCRLKFNGTKGTVKSMIFALKLIVL